MAQMQWMMHRPMTQCCWQAQPISSSPHSRGQYKATPRSLAIQRTQRRLWRPTTCTAQAPSSQLARKPTPHSGYHFDGTSRRFFEGWYFKVTLPGDGQSFAWMYSIEDPGGRSDISGAGAQVMGPGDGYLVQHSRTVDAFWGDRTDLALGACFRPRTGPPPRSIVPEADFDAAVEQGYQVSTTWHQGSLIADESSVKGDLPSTTQTVRWAYSTRLIYAWGPSGAVQRATAGWLAALPVFEPHWQILMAQGLSTGWVEWGGQRYTFTDAPSYSEKNWGSTFPSKWFWVCCNTFDARDPVALTAVGARRGVLNLPGVEEDVGLIGVHWQGRFIELVPWTGSVHWDVAPWGRWHIWARNDDYEAEVIATAQADEGTPLRAPTNDGLIPMCKDTFFGKVHLRIWRLQGGKAVDNPILDCSSTSGALEVGGRGWTEHWRSEAAMKEPLKSFIKLPVNVEGLVEAVPGNWRPPGL